MIIHLIEGLPYRVYVFNVSVNQPQTLVHRLATRFLQPVGQLKTLRNLESHRIFSNRARSIQEWMSRHHVQVPDNILSFISVKGMEIVRGGGMPDGEGLYLSSGDEDPSNLQNYTYLGSYRNPIVRHPPPPPPPPAAGVVAFPNQLMSATIDITRKQDGGVHKKIIREGTGASSPVAGSTVFVHYVGTLADGGEKFDSSRDRGEEFKFTLGREQVIKGWDLGVATMKKDELAEFTITAEYAYGASGSPPKIPPNATLIFEVELVRWESEDLSPDRDFTITRDVIVKGEELAHPNDTSEVEVHAVGSYEGRVFYDRDVTFSIGEGSEVGLPEGVDRALRRMTRGEKSIIHIKGTRFTYGNTPPAEFGLPPNAPIDFTLFLKSYVKVPATWELTVDQKLTAAQESKEKGTQFLKEGKYKLALSKYKRIEDLLEYERSADPQIKEKRDALMIAAYLNIALTHSKMTEELECIKACDKVLELSPGNVKALYRKGMAKLSFSDYEDALEIFKQVVAKEPENKAAQQQILVCKQKIREFEEKEKRRFKELFAKLGQDTADEQNPQKEQKNPFEEKAGVEANEENAEPMESESNA